MELDPKLEQVKELEAKIKMYEAQMDIKKKAGLEVGGIQAEVKGLREILNALK